MTYQDPYSAYWKAYNAATRGTNLSAAATRGAVQAGLRAQQQAERYNDSVRAQRQAQRSASAYTPSDSYTQSYNSYLDSVNSYFDSLKSLASTLASSYKPSSTGQLINGRRFYGDSVDRLTGQSNRNINLGGGNDFLEIIGGANNFANGGIGSDTIRINGGKGRYLGGSENDTITVDSAEAGTHVNGNRGQDLITGVVDGVTYRGGSENDTLQVSAGTVYGDLGADTFKAVAGLGVAVVQDYTAGQDVIQGIAGGSFASTADGLVYGVGSDQMLLLAGVTDVSQVTVV